MRKTISTLLKFNIIICAFAGITISLITAKTDGYSHWTRRLLYFTSQSNIWIFIAIILLLLAKNTKFLGSFIVVRYVFTVAITMTGIIFCCLLAPFAEESYHVWSAGSFLTHVFVPLFATIDFFVDNSRVNLGKKEMFFCIIPGLIYTAVTSVLFFFKIDFGRGDNFPYFFYNYLSPAGIFGFSSTFPYITGSFYWISLIVIILLIISSIYAKINNKLLDIK